LIMSGVACLTLSLGIGVAATVCATGGTVRQLTFDSKNHCLDNNDNFSPDDRFLCFDTRPPDGNIANGRTIEKVDIETGKITVLYEAENPRQDFGPGMGAVSYSPVADEGMFICGKLTSLGLKYEKHRRFGRVAAGDGSGKTWIMDARDVTPPFTPGALRGGTHRHEPDATGKWVGYTYNDQIMHALGKDLRTIGVTQLGKPVKTDRDPKGENHDGEGWSVLVVRVTPDPKPGSDEINQAAGDSWVGTHGYQRADGKRQLARAFLGRVKDKNGREVEEVFIVDIPADLTKPGAWGPLEGTEDSFPQPPAGTVQRRLTFSTEKKIPGAQGVVRSSPDGSQLSFIMADESGIPQVFLISPLGGEPHQATFEPDGVTLSARWHPSGNSFLTVNKKGQLIVVNAVPGDGFGKAIPLTEAGEPEAFDFVWSRKGNLIAFGRTMPDKNGNPWKQIFVMDFPDSNRDGLPD